MKFLAKLGVFAVLACVAAEALQAQGKRKVIIDQDCAGPGGTAACHCDSDNAIRA